jgi:hypothetical protein
VVHNKESHHFLSIFRNKLVVYRVRSNLTRFRQFCIFDLVVLLHFHGWNRAR